MKTLLGWVRSKINRSNSSKYLFMFFINTLKMLPMHCIDIINTILCIDSGSIHCIVLIGFDYQYIELLRLSVPNVRTFKTSERVRRVWDFEGCSKRCSKRVFCFARRSQISYVLNVRKSPNVRNVQTIRTRSEQKNVRTLIIGFCTHANYGYSQIWYQLTTKLRQTTDIVHHILFCAQYQSFVAV